MEKGQQKWTAQGCNNMEINQALPLGSLALETSLPCWDSALLHPSSLVPSPEHTRAAHWQLQLAIVSVSKQRYKNSASSHSLPEVVSGSH